MELYALFHLCVDMYLVNSKMSAAWCGVTSIVYEAFYSSTSSENGEQVRVQPFLNGRPFKNDSALPASVFKHPGVY